MARRPRLVVFGLVLACLTLLAGTVGPTFAWTVDGGVEASVQVGTAELDVTLHDFEASPVKRGEWVVVGEGTVSAQGHFPLEIEWGQARVSIERVSTETQGCQRWYFRAEVVPVDGGKSVVLQETGPKPTADFLVKIYLVSSAPEQCQEAQVSYKVAFDAKVLARTAAPK